MTQYAEGPPRCAKCHHPREAHLTGDAGGPPSTLSLRERCEVPACDCACYIGLVWEAPISERSRRTVGDANNFAEIVKSG